MKAEIIAIGSGWLTPFRQDTNSFYLTPQLERLGIPVMQKTVVGDDRERLKAAFGDALRRVELVIGIGGLGPAEDDRTREAVAELLGRKLKREEEVVARMEERFRARGRKMPEVNLRQAMVPDGADWLPNDHGTAPGLWLETDDQRIVLLLPGPPPELKPMFEELCLARLRPRAPQPVFAHKGLKTVRLAGAPPPGGARPGGDSPARLRGRPRRGPAPRRRARRAPGAGAGRLRLCPRAGDARAGRGPLPDDARGHAGGGGKLHRGARGRAAHQRPLQLALLRRRHHLLRGEAEGETRGRFPRPAAPQGRGVGGSGRGPGPGRAPPHRRPAWIGGDGRRRPPRRHAPKASGHRPPRAGRRPPGENRKTPLPRRPRARPLAGFAGGARAGAAEAAEVTRCACSWRWN